MTTTEAAALTGLPRRTIQTAIRRGHLLATKIGRDWQIDRADLDKWLASPRKVGRPKKETQNG